MRMRACLGLVAFLVFSVLLVSPGFCQDSLTESVSTKIEVHKDGSATWTIESRFLLKTAEDTVIFQQYLSEFEAEKQTYLSEFSNKTNGLISRASVITARSMSAENFQVATGLVQTATANYGVVTYQYDWISFAKLEETRIAVGDVFEGGFYLFQGDALTVQYPVEFDVTAAVPAPDETKNAERLLMWYGRRNFGAGEPTVILDEKSVSSTQDLQGYLPVVFGAVTVLVGGVSGLYFFKYRKKKVDSENSLMQVTLKKMEDDEQKVIRLLKSSGGQLYQSLIAKHCSFSTSKASELLTAMESKGLIVRKLKGREKIVTLIEQK